MVGAHLVRLGKTAGRLCTVAPCRKLGEARRINRLDILRQNKQLSQLRQPQREPKQPQIIVHAPFFQHAPVSACMMRGKLELRGFRTGKGNLLTADAHSHAVIHHALQPVGRR